MARYLSIIATAYRATVEEQDDTALWFTHAMKNAGAQVAVLLKGDAVGYTQAGQDARGLRFGTREVRVPPELDRDLEAAMAKGIPVYVVGDDLAERGIAEGSLLAGIQRLSRDQLARFVADHDRVLYW
jgi:sulfur relay (sulfurtransferase) DsrF/TusC family protein